MNGNAGQWGGGGGRPEVSGMRTSPTTSDRWKTFTCSVHADRFDGPEWCDVGLLDDDAHTELDGRRARWQAALDGKGWRPPPPWNRDAAGAGCNAWRTCRPCGDIGDVLSNNGPMPPPRSDC